MYRVQSPPQVVAKASWQELRRWPGTRAWQVRFATPACARRRNRTAPLLAPEALARGLAERWRYLDPATAPEVAWREAGPVWVSDLDGHSEVQILSRRLGRAGRPVMQEEIISGFTGRVRYVCDHGSDADAACFDALLAFAAFAGAGSHTAYGFGVVVPEPTWQPPTVQMTGQHHKRSAGVPDDNGRWCHQHHPASPAGGPAHLRATLAQVADPDQLATAWDDVLVSDWDHGVVGLGVTRFACDAEQHLSEIAAQLTAGTYQPGRLAPVALPRPGGLSSMPRCESR